MHIFLINCPVRLEDDPRTFPTGLGYIASVLRQSGYVVSVLDINAWRYSDEKVVQELKALANVDVIGISGLITTYKYQKWLINEIKCLYPEKTVISGGGLATSNSDLLFKNTRVDYTVIGEGEKTIIELLEALQGKLPVASVKGIAYRDGDTGYVATEKRALIDNLDELPMPAYDLFPTEIYIKNPIWGGFKGQQLGTKTMNIIGSRGCPFNCHYCYHLFGRSKYRFRSPENIVEEIRYLRDNYGVDFIAFTDDNTTANRKRLETLSFLLESENIIWGCHGRVDSVDEDIVAKMFRGGCRWLGFGIESGSEKMLKLMNKQATVEKSKKAIELTRQSGIFPNTTFIIGYPGETYNTIMDTINFGIELDLVVKPFYATAYPGTRLYEIALDMGLIQDEEVYIENLNNAFDFTLNYTDFTDQELQELRKKVTDITLQNELSMEIFRHGDKHLDSGDISYAYRVYQTISVGKYTQKAKTLASERISKIYKNNPELNSKLAEEKVKLMVELSDQAIKAKDFESALNFVREAEKVQDDEFISCRLAEVYYLSGNKIRSKAVCKKTLTKYPESRKAQEILDLLEGKDFVKCNVCGSNDTEWISGTSRYEIKVTNVICKKCGLVYINPRQTKQELEKYYQEQYRKQYKVVDIHSEAYREGKRKKAEALFKYVPEGGKVLEIGCANGVLLSEMKKIRPDIELYGIEPTSDLAAQVSHDYGINVFCGMLEDYPEHEHKFDLIILDHVLEHFDDPLNALKIIRTLIQDTGHVYIEVPDIGQPYGDFDYNFLQNAHLFSFSYKTIGLLFKLAGYTSVMEGTTNCLGFVLQKGRIFSREEISFDQEGENFKELLKFINVYRNRFRAQVVEDTHSKEQFQGNVLRTEIELELRMSKMYKQTLRDNILEHVQKKNFEQAQKNLRRFFDVLDINPIEMVQMLILGSKLAESTGDKQSFNTYKALLGEVRKVIKDNGLRH